MKLMSCDMIGVSHSPDHVENILLCLSYGSLQLIAPGARARRQARGGWLAGWIADAHELELEASMCERSMMPKG